ncbi:MAG: twin-arginine translocase TatA/TatE family subunit [Mycobacteriaceae bacterium]
MDLGPSELLIILLMVVLLFGAKKLPELARGAGQSLRIFKEETRAARTVDIEGPPRGTSTPPDDQSFDTGGGAAR